MTPSYDISTLRFRHELPVQIRFNDVDVIGHVNNSVLLSYFDLGKVSYFEAMGYKGVRSGDVDLVIVHVDVDYMVPVFMEDDIVVRTKVLSVGNKSVKLVQMLYDRRNDRVKCVAIRLCADSILRTIPLCQSPMSGGKGSMLTNPISRNYYLPFLLCLRKNNCEKILK